MGASNFKEDPLILTTQDMKKQFTGYPYLKHPSYSYNHGYQFVLINNFLYFRKWETEQLEKNELKWQKMKFNHEIIKIHADGDNLWVEFVKNEKHFISSRRKSWDDRHHKDNIFTSKLVFETSDWLTPWNITQYGEWSSSNFGAFSNSYQYSPENHLHWYNLAGEYHVGCSTIHWINKKKNQIQLGDPWDRLVIVPIKYFDDKDYLLLSSSSSVTGIVYNQKILTYVGNFDVFFIPKFTKVKKDITRWKEHPHSFNQIKHFTLVQQKDSVNKMLLFVLNEKDELWYKTLDDVEWKIISN